ncbi:MAG: hypothetical protein F083_2700 [bacterium F083]|nr:MAG: hypothetical protein F083_2700 [bacterium F083]
MTMQERNGKDVNEYLQEDSGEHQLSLKNNKQQTIKSKLKL